MGKKSRRKKEDKKVRATRLQERRERLDQETSVGSGDRADAREHDDVDNDSEIIWGDRVWCFRPTCRAVVTDIRQDGSIEVLPVDAPEATEGEENEHRFVIEDGDYVKDKFPWTLRFDIGQQVVCKTDDGWRAAEVSEHFPIEQFLLDGFSTMPCYKCKVLGSRNWNYVCAPEDSDRCVVKRVPKSSARFSKEDEVMISVAKVEGLRRRVENEHWVTGRVSQVEVFGSFYAVYECVVPGRDRKPEVCYVLKDTDEHITAPRLLQNPRERLMGSLKSGCSYDHYDFLLSSLDVMSFCDLVLRTAINHGNVAVLLWLEKNTSLNFELIEDENGNRLLHQISLGENAAEFFQNDDCKEEELYSVRSEAFTAVNNDGETWFDILLRTENIRAMEVVLNPNSFWRNSKYLFSNVFRGSVADVKGVAQRKRLFIVVKMLDEFSTFQKYLCLVMRMYIRFPCDDEEQLEMTNKALPNPKAMIAFFRKWAGRPCYGLPHIRRLLQSLAEKGQLRLVTWFVEADNSLMIEYSEKRETTLNRDEFVQAELLEKGEGAYIDLGAEEIRGLVSWAVLGQCRVAYFTRKDVVSYLSLLVSSACTPFLTTVSLADTIKNWFTKYDHGLKSLVQYKIALLRDDENLTPRLAVIDYLVKEQGASPPLAVDLVRWRQCGVLRWLVHNSFLELKNPASKERYLVGRENRRCILSGRPIPASMTSAVFLCLAAIEFDDLQTLEWLIVDFLGMELAIPRYQNWNVFHIAARYGRSEILLWLQTRPGWKELMEELCGRSPSDPGSIYAIHLAIERGFVCAADILAAAGCPVNDERGETPDFYARRSEHEFVREWGAKKENPRRLTKNLLQLKRLLTCDKLNENALKIHISSTGCLDFKVWRKNELSRFNKPGPLGLSYLETVVSCCESTSEAFVEWLMELLTHFDDQLGAHNFLWLLFWDSSQLVERKKEHASGADLKKIAEAIDDEGVTASWLEINWGTDMELKLGESNPMVNHIQKCLQENRSVSEALSCFQRRSQTVALWLKISELATTKAEELIARGCTPQEVDTFLSISLAAKSKVAIARGVELESLVKEYDLVLCGSQINVDIFFPFFDSNMPLRPEDSFCWFRCCRADYQKLYLFLALQGYDDLIRWTVNGKGTWTASMEVDAVRIASYFGREETVGMFLESNLCWSSKIRDRLEAAVLGAAEAGLFSSVRMYLSAMQDEPSVQFFEPHIEWTETIFDEPQERWELRAWSLPDMMTFGYLACSSSDISKNEASESIRGDRTEMLRWILKSSTCTPDALLLAAGRSLQSLLGMTRFERFLRLFELLLSESQLDLWSHQQFIVDICDIFVMRFSFEREEHDRMASVLRKWLEKLVHIGFDVETVDTSQLEEEKLDCIRQIQLQQRRARAPFDLIKGVDISLEEITQAVDKGSLSLDARDRGGLLLVHLAAAYDRAELVSWLVTTKDVLLSATDGQGRDVLQVAKASSSLHVVDWILKRNARRTISRLASTRIRQKLAIRRKQRRLHAIKSLQSWFRGLLVRKTYRDIVSSRLEGSQRFRGLWQSALLSLNTSSEVIGPSWSAIKVSHFDIMHSSATDADDKATETGEILRAATQAAIRLRGADDNSDGDVLLTGANREDQRGGSREFNFAHQDDLTPELNVYCTEIRLTHDVVRWLRHSDAKYRQFFLRRVEQLAGGQKSRILAKGLVGCKSRIFETYLEQKSGQRILWTSEAGGEVILFWYVAKHKDVSRLVRLIDDVESRSNRSRVLASSHLSEISHEQNIDGNPVSAQILLNPLGNAPLKLYHVNSKDLHRLADPDWCPPMRLTAEEREIVEAEGTVLLLGRSGTGKTSCICSRMDFDRSKNITDPSFRQLFVARSQRLSQYVKSAVGSNNITTFTTFKQLVRTLEALLPPTSGMDKPVLSSSQRMDFSRFRQEFLRSAQSAGIDVLIVWTNIRSFIKGSIEALKWPGRVLPREEYVSFLKIGRKRCRLEIEQREKVYDIFEKYLKYTRDLRLWDDCDRISFLLERIQIAKTNNNASAKQLRYSKVYVDEVQDLTQAEILLFFYLGGPGDLFFAGDPAQAVVEGVDFRFEEIRSVGYYVAAPASRDLIPSKPMSVNVNFRSHSGVLNVAAALLQRLFSVFPDSAKILREDRGMFKGPRPGVSYGVATEKLKDAIVGCLKGTVILAHDEQVLKWRRILEPYQLIYGIRQAKGLEFHNVIVLDFFCGLPQSLQKPWRDLLLTRDTSNFRESYPEVEGQLKLLYTAITRCIEQLCLVETAKSIAGDAAVRWLTTTSIEDSSRFSKGDTLAEKLDICKASSMGLTSDQLRVAGLDNAIAAESSFDLEESESFLEKALYCFQLINDETLARKARAFRSSILLRKRFEGFSTDQPDPDGVDLEMEVAKTMQQLLSEDLLREARILCEMALPLFDSYAREQITRHILCKLPLFEED